jgi:hypothetical protein
LLTIQKKHAKYFAFRQEKALVESGLKDLRTAFLSVLGFSGFFRASALTSIKAKDMTVNPDNLILFVPTSKIDRQVLQWSSGFHRTNYRTNVSTCFAPSLFSLAIAFTQIQTRISSDTSKLPVVVKQQLPLLLNVLVTQGYVKSYCIGLDPKQYSTHSLRSGGALFMATSQS